MAKKKREGTITRRWVRGSLLVTILVLVVSSLRRRAEEQPPASLGLSYFREDR